MSAQRIHIGRGVNQLGEQRCDLAGVSPRLARREYSVDAGNARYLAREGNLFSDGGRELVFLASPYGERVSLPDGVERVASSAFADGCEPLRWWTARRRLRALTLAAGTTRSGAARSRLPRTARFARGVRLAGPAAVELEGCWYDFDAEGAVLVAGPPKPISVSRRFAEQAAVRAVAVRGKDEVADDADACALSPAAAAAEAATEFAASGKRLHRGLRVGQRERCWRFRDRWKGGRSCASA
ncbi:MAG: hypothetical protein ACLSVD_05280 [Eggerthellaceae bacterium]